MTRRIQPATFYCMMGGLAIDRGGFLHDGPAIKKLGVIEGLNGLTPREILELRAFLYSL